jgi:hypothetical protein
MKRLVMVALLMFAGIASCKRSDNSATTGDPLTGMWSGDFGPAFYDRNTISLQLKWDGSTLTGVVQPGDPTGRMYRKFSGFPIENASFDPVTGVVKFDAVYQPKGRRYLILGKVSRNSLMGTWTRPDDNRDGDFRLIRQR